MADTASRAGVPPNPASELINNRFAVDPARPLPHGGGGLPVFAAKDRLQSDAARIAIAVSRDASPRTGALALLTQPIENLMTPLGYGVVPLADRKTEGAFVICPPPPGPPPSDNGERWPERALLELVLKPMAQVLDALQRLKLTHRAIRLDNVFPASPGQPVTLGAAWAAPPAWHQPAVFEPIYSAMCHRSARGEGSIADDVYALGVLLLGLSAGKPPLSGLDDAAVIRAKLEAGSFAALTREGAPAGVLGELLRGMLADDPDHRPSPRLLLDTAAARGRRLATRPPPRSQLPFRVNGIAASDARSLAYALAVDDRQAIQLLRSGQVSLWLRRELGDAALAARIEELVRTRSVEARPTALSDPFLALQVVATINPRMPMTWRGVMLWPDGLPALAAEALGSPRDFATVAEELLGTDIIARWSGLAVREGRGERFALPPETALHRKSLAQGAAGLTRLFYVLNPGLPCRAKRLAGQWAVSIGDMLRQLESTVADDDAAMIDDSLAMFIAARGDRRIEPKIVELNATRDPALFRVRELELLRELQARYHPAPLPRLANWVAERLKPDLARWHHQGRRDALGARLGVLAREGMLGPLLALTQDKANLAADREGVRQALTELRQIDAELAAIDDYGTKGSGYVAKASQAITSGLGLAALILAALGMLTP